MKKINVEDAVGMELCHDITAIRDGFKGAEFKTPERFMKRKVQSVWLQWHQ